MPIDVTASDTITAVDACRDVIEGEDFTSTRCLRVTAQDRYLWVTVPVHMQQPIIMLEGSLLDYGVIWSDWLAPGETILESTWEIPEELAEVTSYVTADGVAVVWLAIVEALPGDRFTVVNRIVTSSTPISREDSRSLMLWVEAA